MWISKKELARLQDRIAALEAKGGPTITVYDQETLRAMQASGFGSMYGYPIPKQEIAISDVVKRILEKLGMELKFVKGQPDRVLIEENGKAK